MAGLKKRVAIKKLQLEEAMLERQLKSSAMPTLTDLVNSGVIEPAPPEDKSQDGDDQDPKNRSKIGF